jgi:uncharacterized protein (DUF1684 family)
VFTLVAWAIAQQIAPDPAAYVQNVQAWREERAHRLTADGGWLTVAGLAWLSPGRNDFGSARSNPVVLPPYAAPARAGSFIVEGDHVTVEVAPGVTVTRDGKPVSRAPLRGDADGGAPDVLAVGAATMQVIARGGKLAIRIKDMRSPARAAFKGLRWYPVNPTYRVTARFVAHAQPKTIKVDTVIGIAEPMASPGYVEFELAGKTVRLEPVIEPGETELFFIFRDATTGRTTYSGGRFLYAEPPRDGRVVLDFNRAYSPPCAFTAFATCPMPPASNRLAVPIEAGELTPPH